MFAARFVAAHQQVGDFRVVDVNGRLEKNGGNVASYFCTPDGRVIHAVTGPVSAEQLLHEARWALDVYDELRDYLDAASTAFLERPRDLDTLVDFAGPHWDLARTWAAFDDGRVVACLRSFPTEVTVPGGTQVPAAALAGVGVLPTHRRRGLLRRLVDAEHAAMRERGEPIGLLNASEYPIYGRFGYGMACRQATWRVETRRTSQVQRPRGAAAL